MNETRTITFLEEALAVLQGFQQASLDVIGRLPGRAVRRPTDLDEALGIGRRPAWQLYRFAHAVDPLAEAGNVPGPAPVTRFLRAAAESGVPGQHVESARSAYRAFLAFVEARAADRRSFDSIVSRYSGNAGPQVDLQHKRAAYRANSHIIGAHGRARAKCTVYARSAERADLVDAAGVSAYFDMRRLRDVPIPLLAAASTTAPGPAGPIRFEALAPEDVVEGVPVLGRFSSQPLPKVVEREARRGVREFEIVPSGVGQESEFSLVVGHLHRALPSPYQAGGGGPAFANRLLIGQPVEVLIQDILVDMEAFPAGEADVAIYRFSGTEDLSSVGPDDFNRLDLQEEVVALGRGITRLQAPGFPRYAEMVAYALDRAGWDPQRFRAFRCRIEYPVLYSLVTMTIELKEQA